MERIAPGRFAGAARVMLVGAVVLGAASFAVHVLETSVGIANASATYLLAVLVMAASFGIPAAVTTAVGSFLLYDLLFVQPTGALVVADPEEWLNLLLLLVLGVVVGQLAGMLRARGDAALLRERQARAQYRIGRALATTPTATAALPEVVRILRTETSAGRAWVALGPEALPRRTASDGDLAAPGRIGASHHVLRRGGGDDRVEWVRVHDPRYATAGGSDPGVEGYRVPIVAGGADRGSLWVLRQRSEGAPGAGDTRVLAAAADQVGQAIERDRLAAEATSAEVSRRSEAAKTALLDSVSHDLRTPLATIRAAAGILRDPALDVEASAVRERADVIDREAERLNELVSNLLDMSRIEAGGLRARLEPFALEDVVETTLGRLGPTLAGHPLVVVIPSDLPPVSVDPVFIDQVLTNLLENVGRHTPQGTRVRIGADERGDGGVVLTVEDAGPGVPAEELGRLFDKFGRARLGTGGSRRGLGLGLAVVRGLVEAMGGSVTARQGDLGGLAVDVQLRCVPEPELGGEEGQVGSRGDGW